MLAGALMPKGSGPVLVIAKPWGASAIEVVAEADGRLVSALNMSWFVLADGEQQDFIASLYRSGAAIVTAPAIAYACARVAGIPLESRT